jgi:hypothetical protein
MTQPPNQPQQWWRPTGAPQNPQPPQPYGSNHPNPWPPPSQPQAQHWAPSRGQRNPAAGDREQSPAGFGYQPTNYGGLGAFGESEPSRKRSKKPLIFGGIGALFVAATGGVAWLLGAFSGDTLDQQSTQDGVTKVLTDSYGEHDVKNTQCPSGEEITTGNTFDCTVEIASQQKKITIRVLNGKPEFVVGAPH